MVEVDLSLERFGLLLRGQDPVEAILAEDSHLPLVVVDLVLSQQLHDLAAHRRLVSHTHTHTKYDKWKIYYKIPAPPSDLPHPSCFRNKWLSVQHVNQNVCIYKLHIWIVNIISVAGKKTHTQNKRLQFTPPRTDNMWESRWFSEQLLLWEKRGHNTRKSKPHTTVCWTTT